MDTTKVPGKPGSLEATFKALETLAVSPQYWKADSIASYLATQDKDNKLPSAAYPPTAEQIASSPILIIQAARAATMMHMIPRPKVRLSKEDRFMTVLKAISADDAPDDITLDKLQLGMGVGGLTDTGASKRAALLAAIVMLFAAGPLLDSDYLKIGQKAEGYTKDEQEVMNNSLRSTRMVVYFEWVATRYFDAALRPYIWYLQQPAPQRRLAYAADPSRLEQFNKWCKIIMDRPTFAWCAEALRLFAPGQRTSHLGRAPSLGLWESTLPRERQWDQNDLGEVDLPVAAGKALDPRLIYAAIQGAVAEYAERIELWERIGQLSSLESSIRAVRVGPPAAVHLWGPDMPIIHASPIAANMLPSTALEMLTAFTLPAALESTTSTRLPFRFEYPESRAFNVIGGQPNASDPRLRTHAILSVMPEEPALYVGPDLLGVIPPHQIRWAKPPLYNGEPDAVLIEASLEGIAAVFGIDVTELTERILMNPRGWEHLLVITPDSNIVFRVDDNDGLRTLVYSSLTAREPVQRFVTVPHMAPTRYFTVAHGYALNEVPVSMRLFGDLVPVQTPMPLDKVTDSLVAAATTPLMR